MNLIILSVLFLLVPKAASTSKSIPPSSSQDQSQSSARPDHDPSLVAAFPTFVSVKLTCQGSASQTPGTCNHSSCQSEYAGRCGNEIPYLSALPEVDQCCCSDKETALVEMSTSSVSAPICTHMRQCSFLCCENLSSFCGTNCCESDEICGADINNGKPCCVNPQNRVWTPPQSRHVAQYYSTFHLTSCCPYGTGISGCGSTQPCCLDVSTNCIEASSCKESYYWTFSRVILLILGFGAASLGLFLLYYITRSQFSKREEKNMTSGAMYHGMGSLACLSED